MLILVVFNFAACMCNSCLTGKVARSVDHGPTVCLL